VALPDGLWLVMDACTTGYGQANLTKALLDHLEVPRLDLLVLSHPDADHVLGMADLIGDPERPVRRLWRYPGMVRDLVAKVTNKTQAPSLEPLGNALKRIDDVVRSAGEDFDVDEVRTRARWDVGDRDYEVVALAPTSYDAFRMERQYETLVNLDDPNAGWEASERFVRALAGERPWSDHPNTVSLGVSIAWGDVRLVLSGDIEDEAKHRKAGWKGVLRALQGCGGEPDRTYLLEGAALVKVAHHGSTEAQSSDAWKQHTASGKVPIAAIAPYSNSHLPTDTVLQDLRARAAALLLTAADAGGAGTRANANGWANATASPRKLAATAPVAAIAFNQSGPLSVDLGGPAQLYV